MLQFLAFFWQMCLLRTSPERAPVSMAFIVFISTVYVTFSTLLLTISNSGNQITRAIQLVLLGVAIQVFCIWLLLAFKQLGSRFRATLVAFLGTNSLLVIFTIPLSLLLIVIDNETIILLIEAAYWLLIFWWLAIAGFILHKATNVSLMLGITLAFTIELLSLVVTSTILPSTVQAVSQS
jgi:hypothetical protein